MPVSAIPDGASGGRYEERLYRLGPPSAERGTIANAVVLSPLSGRAMLAG